MCMSSKRTSQVIPLYVMSNHRILVIRDVISYLHVMRHGTSTHIYVRHHKRVLVLVDYYVKSLTQEQ